MLLVVLQLPLVIVQLKIYVPYNDAEAVVTGLTGSVKVTVPGPETWAQAPEPADGVFPDRETLSIPQIS
jgi:YbbR domain-containing protein